jgi:uncharacterized protein with FMN-binding domain
MEVIMWFFRETRVRALTRLARLVCLACAVIAASCAGGEYRTGPGTPALPGSSTARRNGVWEGTGQGYGGEIRLQVRIASGLIQEIGINAHNEDPFIGGQAMAELLELVLDYQSTDLDAVSGATASSAGFLAAVEDALDRAAAP